MKIGFIGMGIMGNPMCLNLLKNNVELGVFNRTQEKTQEIIDSGARFFASEKELGEWADSIIIMVSDDEAVRSVVDKIEDKAIIVCMSTISLDMTRKLTTLSEQENFEFINAPVSGTKKPAEDGTLVILAGGKEEVIEKLKEAFDAMGKATVHAGNQEDAAKMKLVVNYLLGTMIEGLAETTVMCDKIGLNKEAFMKTVSGGPLGCGFFNIKSDNLLNKNFEPSFPTKHMLKDLKYLEQELKTKDYKVKSNLIDLFEKTNKEFSEEDLSAIYKILKK